MPIAVALLLALSIQGANTAQVKEARKLAKDAGAFADKNPSRKKMFMLRGEKKWVAMKKDSDHLKDEVWSEDVSLVAFVWARNGKTLLASYTAGSPSGDWTASKTCTYRPSGTLAHTDYRFATFMFGGRVLEQETIFDEKGKKIFASSKCTDFDGKKKVTGEEAKQIVDARVEIKDYLKVGQLPFPRR
jgi:hypothetical protein